VPYGDGELTVRIPPGLRFFLAARHRSTGEVRTAADGTSTLGHVVTSLGVPPTEVGALAVDGRSARASYRPGGGENVDVTEAPRPQLAPPRFLLDVHLGTLARRMRLLGLDTDYPSDPADDRLLARANAACRVLLTQDRGLLARRALRFGAHVRGAGPDAQLADVLDRFDPPLAPWSRCTACNAGLVPADKADVRHLLPPGTRRTYDTFTRCPACGRVYWRGAHSGRLEAIVACYVRLSRSRRVSLP
jgi:uncharacterized protein with PIN domain